MGETSPLNKPLAAALKKVNAELKQARSHVKVELRQNNLFLRGTLPSKTDVSADWKQQRIPIGVRGNMAGIEKAKAIALQVSSQLTLEKFKWSDWIELEKSSQTFGDLIDRFEEDYFLRRSKSPKTLATFAKEYRSVFNKLDRSLRIEKAALIAVVKSTKADSKTRKRTITSISALAKFAGIEIDLKPYKGSYSDRPVDPRSLPSDRQILEFWYSIPESQVRYCLALMATYGLRNHECFNLDLSSLTDNSNVLKVKDGKTGKREVFPFYDYWFDLFELDRPDLPQIESFYNSGYGRWVTRKFQKYGMAKFGFQKAYDPRHCWARRAFAKNLPEVLAAKQMGHGLEVHVRKYQTWIDRAAHQQAYDRIFPDRLPQEKLIFYCPKPERELREKLGENGFSTSWDGDILEVCFNSIDKLLPALSICLSFNLPILEGWSDRQEDKLLESAIGLEYLIRANLILFISLLSIFFVDLLAVKRFNL